MSAAAIVVGCLVASLFLALALGQFFASAGENDDLVRRGGGE